MKRVMLFWLLVISGLSPCFACIATKWTVMEVMENEELIVFYGQAIHTENLGENMLYADIPLITQFKVLNAWSGNFNKNNVLIYQDNACFTLFEEGKYYLVVGYNINNKIWTHDGYGEQVLHSKHPKLSELQENYSEVEIGGFNPNIKIIIILVTVIGIGWIVYGIYQLISR